MVNWGGAGSHMSKAESQVRTGRSASQLLEDIEERFKEIAGADERIDVDELQAGLRLNDADYARRIFNLVDRDDSGDVTVWEFIEFAKVLVEGTPEEKLRIVFDLHDINGDGTVDENELTHILDRSLNEHSLEISQGKLEALSRALFANIDTDQSGGISFAEFKACLDAHPDLRDQMIATSATWLRLPQRIPADRRGAGRGVRGLGDYVLRLWENDRPWLVLLIAYVAGNIWIFRDGMIAESMMGSDLQTQVAFGAAAALKLNGVIVLVSMLRMTWTYLRRTPIGPWLPLDHMIDFHRIVGHTAILLAVVHIGGFIAAYETMVDPDFFTREMLYGSLIRSTVGWSGLTLIGIFIVMWVCALKVVRDKGLFELFYFTHQLFWIWFAFLIVHYPTYWQWVVVPGALFIIEQGIRLVRGRLPATLETMTAMPSNVTRLRLRRPKSFDYKPGEYVFVRHPAVSRREWHPFTVTSNPEDRERLELHVRSIGTWTTKLNELASRPVPERPPTWDRVYLDGPYGSPASDIFDSRIPVLIGAGIGVTPFASILRSILERRRADDPSVQHIEKIHFIWLNRDQQAFEWFVELMAQLEQDPATKDMIEIQVFLTGLRAQLTSASLTIAMEVYHRSTGLDLLTALRARTQPSRPNWQSLFKQIRDAHPKGDVDVYFCGPEGLSRVLARECGRFDFGYKKENF